MLNQRVESNLRELQPKERPLKKQSDRIIHVALTKKFLDGRTGRKYLVKTLDTKTPHYMVKTEAKYLT